MTSTTADIHRLIEDLREAMQHDPDPSVVRQVLQPLLDGEAVVIDLTDDIPSRSA